MTTPLKPPPVIKAVAPKYSVVGTKAAEGHPRKKCLYWGMPFTGKTNYAKSYPGPFFMYFDPDTTTLLSHPTEIPYVIVTSKAMMDALAADVRNRKLTEVVRSFGPQWADYTVQTVVIDSSTFQDKLIEEWLDDTDTKGINRWDIKSRTMHSFYGDICAGSTFKAGADQYYVVVTAHEAVKRDKEGNITEITTCISGNFRNALIQYMDTVIFCEVVVPSGADGKALATPARYICRTSPPDKFRKCGARGIVKLPPVLENGAFYEVLQKFWSEDPKEK